MIVPTLLLLAFLPGCTQQDYVISEARGRLVVSPTIVDLDVGPVGVEVPISLQLMAIDSKVTVKTVNVRNVDGDYFSLVTTEMPAVEEDGFAALDFLYLPTEAGYHWAEATIETDEKENPTHVIPLKGAAADATATITPTLIDFGPVRAGTRATSEVVITNTGLVPIEIAGIASTHDAFSTDAVLPYGLDPGTFLSFLATFDPTNSSEATGELIPDLGDDLVLSSVQVRGNACSTASGALYDQDNDGYGWCGGDCNDDDSNIRPGVVEVCDGTDNNCNGVVDEDTTCYDDDGDGFDEADGDCNDGDPLVNPGAEEVPINGVDDDCDGTTDAGSGDRDGDGYAASATDCDDYDATVYPGAPELPDGQDNDCDTLIDEFTTSHDDDGDGWTEGGGDCDDTNPDVYRGATELEDWIDNDCDGAVDEDTNHSDDDADGFSEIGGDCDDTDPTISPAETDAFGDLVDSDCDGSDF